MVLIFLWTKIFDFSFLLSVSLACQFPNKYYKTNCRKKAEDSCAILKFSFWLVFSLDLLGCRVLIWVLNTLCTPSPNRSASCLPLLSSGKFGVSILSPGCNVVSDESCFFFAGYIHLSFELISELKKYILLSSLIVIFYCWNASLTSLVRANHSARYSTSSSKIFC